MKDIYIEMIIVAVIYTIVTITLLLTYRYIKKKEKELYCYSTKTIKEMKKVDSFVPKYYFLKKLSLASILFFTVLVIIVEIVLFTYSLKL